MNSLASKLITTTFAAATLFCFGAMSTPAQTPATSTKAPKMKAPATPPPTDAEIADASAKGLVWVNLNTKVYHKPGVPTYGHTKSGKFMTEADAKAAGYKAAQEPKMKKAAAAATPKQ